MKILISPAKTLNFKRKLPISEESFTQPLFQNEATKINGNVRKLSPAELMDLLSISRRLAYINWQRNQVWHLPFTPDNAYPAVFAFDGPVYQGLSPFNILPDKYDVLQNSLRIISGMHGLLKPFDLIMPYRMEMGIKLRIGRSYLLDFWKNKITEALNNDLDESNIVVNLASKEYFSAIDTKKLKAKLVTIEFKELKEGELKTIVIYTKRARGLMTRFIVNNNLQTIDELKLFDYEAYHFDEKLSSDELLVFVR